MSRIRKPMKELLGTIVRSGKTDVTTEQMKTVAVATGNKVAAKFLDNASIKQQAALKRAIADKDPMFEQPPVNPADDDANVFGMAGTDKVLDKEEQEQIYTPEPVESTNETPEDKDMRARDKVEDHRPNTSDHKVDIAAVSEALSVDAQFPEILDRGEKDPVEKRGSKKGTIKRSTLEKLAQEELDIQAILSNDHPEAAKMVSNVSAAVDYTIDGAMSFCLNLLEDVNAHSEMGQVRDIFETSLNKFSAKTAADDHVPGVPDGSGPHGRGDGPGAGQGDGTGLKNKSDGAGDGPGAGQGDDTGMKPKDSKDSKDSETPEKGKKPKENEVKEFFIDNPNPEDDDVHDWAKDQGFEPDDVEQVVYKLLTDFLKKPDKDKDKGKDAPKPESKPESEDKPTDAPEAMAGIKTALEVMPEETVTIKDDTGVEQNMIPAGSDPITGEVTLVPEGTNVTTVSAKELRAAVVVREIRTIATEINQQLTTEEEDEVNQFVQRELVLNRADFQFPQNRTRIANVINGIVTNRK